MSQRLRLAWKLLIASNYVVFLDFEVRGDYKVAALTSIIEQLRLTAYKMERNQKDNGSTNEI